ncbi:chemotaxis protein CheB [Lysobacter fragariae]
MREALDQAGANIALVADPTTTDQASVLAAQPEVALIVLDAATDEALDRFDDLLANPNIEVFFEEAELAVGRVGWDAARWVRHLAAKLRHSQDVLPPGRDAPAAPPGLGVATVMPMQIQDIEPANGAGMTDDAVERVDVHANLELVTADFTEAAPNANAARPQATSPFASFELEPVDEVAPLDVHANMELVSTELGDQSAHYSDEHQDEPASPLVAKFELELVDETPTEIKLEGMGLETDHPAEADRFHNDLADLHTRIASMELSDDRPSAGVRGAVLILAGIGGPDAVRQLLGALPENFPRAVLVQQRLDGGHYDKLVAQMQRATTSPVTLAIVGDALQAATVYILPPTLGVQESGQGLVFTDSPVDLLVALPANDSAVLMLSGSDPTQVDAVMKLAAGGALVAGQALDGCYDIAAPSALVSRGGQAGKPQELARRLAERWH